MAIVYDKLLAMLEERRITSYKLRKMEHPIISQAKVA